MQIRFDRLKFDRAIVYFKGERMGEARPVDFVANDRKPIRKTNAKPHESYDVSEVELFERRLIAEARRLNAAGKMLAPIIDDAHLMDVTALRKIRLLFEDFPKNHCLVLVAQPELLQTLTLTVNDDLKNRVTYSVLLKKLAPDSIADFIRSELDKPALAHSTFSDDALSLIVRSSEGGLRKTRNLCLGALLEAVRDRTKVVRPQARQPRPAPATLAQRGRSPALSRPRITSRTANAVAAPSRAAAALLILPRRHTQGLRRRWS